MTTCILRSRTRVRGGFGVEVYDFSDHPYLFDKSPVSRNSTELERGELPFDRSRLTP